MKKFYYNYIALVVLVITTISCSGGGGDDGPPPPPPPPENLAPATTGNLIFPSANLLCIDNNITFDWDDAIDPDGDNVTYRITIARDRALTQIEETREVATSQVTITLEQGVAFYWNIVTIDTQRAESAPTDTQAFFTMGVGISNNAPFTAALVAPPNINSTIPSGTISLMWAGGDSNPDDVLTFDVFFGTDAANLTLVGDDISAETFDVMTDPATTYFWSINTTDDSGATSVGPVWSFTTN